MTVPFWRLGYRFRPGEIPLLERRARVKAGFSWRFFHTEHRRGARVRKLLVASIHRQTVFMNIPRLDPGHSVVWINEPNLQTLHRVRWISYRWKIHAPLGPFERRNNVAARVFIERTKWNKKCKRGKGWFCMYIEVNIWKKGVALYKSSACRLIGTLGHFTYTNFNRIAYNRYTTSEKY